MKRKLTSTYYFIILEKKDFQESTPKIQMLMFRLAQTSHFGLWDIIPVASSIPARSHTFVEIDHEIISTVILLPSAESFKKGCCQLQAKVCARSTG